jgi:hypothetical protein
MSTQFLITKFVPIPEARANTKYPWRKLIVSENFLVPCESDRAVRTRLFNSLTSCARCCERQTGRKFVMRSVEKGIRVWRVR